jgi:hypothetical protein
VKLIPFTAEIKKDEAIPPLLLVYLHGIMLDEVSTETTQLYLCKQIETFKRENKLMHTSQIFLLTGEKMRT